MDLHFTSVVSNIYSSMCSVVFSLSKFVELSWICSLDLHDLKKHFLKLKIWLIFISVHICMYIDRYIKTEEKLMCNLYFKIPHTEYSACT